MKRFALLFAVLLLLLTAVSAQAEEETDYYLRTPELVRFTQTISEKKTVGKKGWYTCTYPKTAREDVNTAIASLVDDMTAAQLDALKALKCEDEAWLDTGAEISRTGEKYLSFLLISRLSSDNTLVNTDMTTRVYDMESGAQLYLTDLFDTGSDFWTLLEQEVRAQLTAYFGEAVTPDADALNALCSREALEKADFTLEAASLQLHYPADVLYEGKETLMHVRLWYRDVRPLMNEAAARSVDNSRYRMVAMTYDDGPSVYTKRLLNYYRNYGYKCTFFVIGQRFGYANTLQREHDAGHQVASHTYAHDIVTRKTIDWCLDDWAKMTSGMQRIFGKAPVCMRAPGGNDHSYMYEGNVPLIHWSWSAADAVGNNWSDEKYANRIIANVRDGGIILMHDINNLVADYSIRVLRHLQDNGWMAVTIEDLFMDAGYALESGHIYYSAHEIITEPK